MAKLTEQNIKQFLEKHSTTGEVIEKLAEYERLEEQGLLLRLPCKVGDTIYLVRKGREDVVERTVDCIFLNGEEIRLGGGYGALYVFGEQVFLTKEEAEQKLASMQKGE